MESIRALYPSLYEYSELARHPAAVLLPYQLSVMTFFELYRMNIPLFAPSPELLARWHLDFRVLNERLLTIFYSHLKKFSYKFILA